MQSGIDYIYKTTSPLTFLSWVESQPLLSKDYNTNLTNYHNYVAEWHKFNRSTDQQIQDSFASLYIDMLRDISLTYSTEEERRFISNCSFTNSEELDIILPFFIQKLKTIILYYNKKREDLKKKIKDLPAKGTNLSVSNVIKDLIFEEIESENLQVFLGTRFTLPTLESINKNLKINVEEIYDDTEYANRPYEISELDIDSKLFLDFKSAIQTAIKKYPVFLQGLKTNFSFNLNLSGTELNLLKKRDFTTYFISDSVDDLKLQLYKNLTTKFMGCDMMYLSTGSSATEAVSGRLFSTTSLTSDPVSNPLNRRYPTATLIPSLSDIYTAYICGGFFVPSKVAAMEYSTFDKTYSVDVTKLEANKVYVFPDPNIVGNAGDYTGEALVDYPIMYEIDVSWNHILGSDGFRHGDVRSSALNQLFYPYQSNTQISTRNKQGVSTPYDSIDFWTGETGTIWSNNDVWPDLDTLERLPIDTRLKSLLIDEGYMVKWFVDIFGNEYGLYKKDVSSVSEKRVAPGVIYVKTTDGKIREFTEALSEILLKLPATVVEEIKNALNIFVVEKTILIETKNYVVVDVINYQPTEQRYISSLYPGFYRKKSLINSHLEKLIGYTYRPSNNSLYLCFTSLSPDLSSSNFKSIIPQIYKVDIGQLKVLQIYPAKNFTTSYSLSSSAFNPPEIDIRFIESGHFSHKEKYGLYNLTYLAYNLNNIPFVVNEKFYSTPYQEALVTTDPLLLKPFFYVYDTNFSIVERKEETGFSSTYTDYAGSYNLEKFKIHRESEVSIITNTVSTNLINTTGSFIYNFNWDDSNQKTIYLGCSSFELFKTGTSIQILPTNSFIINDTSFYDILYFEAENRSFVWKGRSVASSNLDKIEFLIEEAPSIFSNQPAFTGDFCKTPSYTIQKTNSKKFDNVLSVGEIDPVFINTTGTTFLHLDWTKYNNINFFIGCSSFNLQFAEDVIFFPQSSVFFTEDKKWYDLINFTIDDRSFFVKSRVMSIDSNDIMELYVGEQSQSSGGSYNQPFTGVFCESLYSIFRKVSITKTGLGDGVITSIPGCLDCGDVCEFLYPVGSTILLKASAFKESIFAGWLGSECQGAVGDCRLIVTDNASISAVFNKQDRFDLTIFVNVTGVEVISFDGEILCQGVGTCTYNFLAGTPVTLSASPAPVGMNFKGFVGGRCDEGSRVCSFFVNKNESLTALYDPSYSSLYIENRYEKSENQVTESFWILGTGDGVDLPENFYINTRYPGFEDPPGPDVSIENHPGVSICGHNDVWGAGTLSFSLCPWPLINHFHVYKNLPTNIFGELFAVPKENFLFAGYTGDRCAGVTINYCKFGIRGDNNITGVFTPPFYTLNVVNYSWDRTPSNIGKVWTFDTPRKISCETYSVAPNQCVAAYLSGTVINITTLPSVGSLVRVLCGTGGFYLSGDEANGVNGLSGNYFLTQNSTLSVFSQATEFETITIHKKYFQNASNCIVSLTPGPSGMTSFTVDRFTDKISLSYPKNSTLQILPQPTLQNKVLYTLGASGLSYNYIAPINSGLILDPTVSNYTQEAALLTVDTGLNIQGVNGPLITQGGPLNVEVRESILTLTSSETVTSFFIPTNYFGPAI
jgi:hypothetical protein